MTLEKTLCWYQERIGLYDKQSWETTVEQHILRGLSYSPCKTAKLKTDLIDVDLVRGSTFPKAKPQSDVWLAGLHGIVRLIFCPLYSQWWIAETKLAGFLLVISMYCSVISSSLIYYYQDDDTLKNIPGFEVFLPFFLLLLLSIIHSQMVCTRRKGIKFPLHLNNKNTYTKKMKNGRRSRSALRNKLISHPKDTYGQRRSRIQNTNVLLQEDGSIKSTSVLNTTSRSQSEDIYTSKSSDKNQRSASENNILYSKLLDVNMHDSGQSSDKTGEDNDAEISNMEQQPANSLADSHLRFRIRSREEETSNVRPSYYNSAKRKFERKTPEKSTVHNNMKVPDLSFSGDLEEEQTSDVGSDEGCSADCESPNTDQDGNRCSEWRKKLKTYVEKRKNLILDQNIWMLGQNRMMYRMDEGDNPRIIRLANQKPNSSSCFSPHASIPKLPVVIVDPIISNSSCESEGEDVANSHPLFKNEKNFFPGWNGVTTNSDDPSYSSESEGGWDDLAETNQSLHHTEPIDWHIQGAPAAVISSTKQVSDKVSCKIWEDSEMKKVNLSVLDIASAVISRVDSLRHSSNYLKLGLIMSAILAVVPSLYRLFVSNHEESNAEVIDYVNGTNSKGLCGWLGLEAIHNLFGSNLWSAILITLSCVNRFILSAGIFFLLSVAERTFKQRFLYAKHFCYMTSARRARKYDLPHFRLNKVINIKAWLSIRSCLKKRGPQHSIDVIVSATFIVTLVLVFYLGVEAIKDEDKIVQPLHNCELFVWCFTISIFLIRFMTLGALINKKYSNPSVLITEQINMYFHMEQNPEKKDKLVLANNVLKLVSVLLKELDSPFKISGLSANTLLYNITKFGILSACSGVLSNLLGFKLKLHSIKFK